jgi:hypothetical protein
MTRRHYLGLLIKSDSILTESATIYYKLTTHPSLRFPGREDVTIELYRMKLDTKRKVFARDGIRVTIEVDAMSDEGGRSVEVNWSCRGPLPISEASRDAEILNAGIHEARRIEMAVVDGRDPVDLYKAVPKSPCDNCFWPCDVEAKWCPKCGGKR